MLIFQQQKNDKLMKKSTVLGRPIYSKECVIILRYILSKIDFYCQFLFAISWYVAPPPHVSSSGLFSLALAIYLSRKIRTKPGHCYRDKK